MIGAPSEDFDSQGENLLSGAGAVYVWKRTAGGSWEFRQKLTPLIRGGGDKFGQSIAIHGAYAIIAAPGKWTEPAQNNRGAAYIFKRDGLGNWQEMSMVYPIGEGEDDNIGESVSLHGRYALLSASGDDHDLGNGSWGLDNGAVYVFERDSLGETWTQIAKLWEADSSSENLAGEALAIEGNYAVLGAHNEAEDENGLNSIEGHGAVYLFERDSSGAWQFHQKLVTPQRSIYNPGQFGHSVDFDNGQLIIGARLHPNQDSLGILRTGAVFVFERDSNGVWHSIQRITSEDLHPQGHGFGYRLSARNGAMIIGAPFDAYQMGPFRGAVYFYKRLPDGTWDFLHKTYEPMGLAGPNNLFGSGGLGIDGPSAIAGTSGAPGVNGAPFNYVYHYEQCVLRHELVKVTSCEPMDFYGNWLDSSGFYEVDIEPESWDCDSLTASVQFDLIEVDTSMIHVGDSLIATASGATFQWMRCGAGRTPIPGATDSVYVPTSTGFYAVAVTQFGCTEISPCLPVLIFTSKDDLLADQLLLYPNPNAGQFRLDLSALAQAADLQIYDATGRWLGSREQVRGQVSLDLREFGHGPGLYLLRVQVGEAFTALRVVWE
jgi:hypothetical protein